MNIRENKQCNCFDPYQKQQPFFLSKERRQEPNSHQISSPRSKDPLSCDSSKGVWLKKSLKKGKNPPLLSPPTRKESHPNQDYHSPDRPRAKLPPRPSYPLEQPESPIRQIQPTITFNTCKVNSQSPNANKHAFLSRVLSQPQIHPVLSQPPQYVRPVQLSPPTSASKASPRIYFKHESSPQPRVSHVIQQEYYPEQEGVMFESPWSKPELKTQPQSME